MVLSIIKIHGNKFCRLRALTMLASVICCLMPTFAANEEAYRDIDFGKFRKENMGRDLGPLMQSAWRNVSNERYDSAAAYYSLVASRYADNLSLRDKRRCAIASVNMGYIWLAWRLNAAEAYPWLMRAREIAEKNDFSSIETAVISNIAQIYFDYNNLPKAVELYKTAIERVAADQDGGHYFSRALIDFTTSAMMSDRVDLIKEMSGKILNVEMPDDEPLHDYVRELQKALCLYASDSKPEAARIIEAATPLFDLETDRKRYLLMHHFMAGKMWLEAGDYEKSELHFNEVIEIASEEGFFNFMEKGYDCLVECGNLRGDSEAVSAYRYRGMQIRDSLFNASRFETVKNLEIAGELNKLHEDVRESVRESQLQRQIILWVSFAGIALLLALVLLYVSHHRLRAAYREIYKSYIEHSSHEEIIPDVPVSADNSKIPDEIAGDAKGMEILARVKEVMETRDEIYKPDFTVDTLAEMIGEKTKGVSQSINSLSGKNFNTMLGEYRIRKACRLLTDSEKMKSMSMEGVAESVGYKSRTYFSRVFKEVTGLTPSQFARQARETSENRS